MSLRTNVMRDVQNLLWEKKKTLLKLKSRVGQMEQFSLVLIQTLPAIKMTVLPILMCKLNEILAKVLTMHRMELGKLILKFIQKNKQ